MTHANNKRAAFTLLLLSGIALRVYIATFGHNSDVESYEIVADLVARGKSVYANTTRYNYGPIWFCFVWGLKSIQIGLGWTGTESFHIVIASFLSLVDTAIAIILARVYGYRVGIFFFINPISILVTGSLSQFDNFALLIGLLAWICISTSQKRQCRNNLLASAVLLGLSLSVKHILVFFPLWILCWTSEINVKRKLEYCTIAYGLFLAGFLPWALDPLSRSGILHNVIQYNSLYGTGILPEYMNPMDMILPPCVVWLLFPVFYDVVGTWFNTVKGYKYLWPIAIVLTGRMTAKFAPDRAFFVYLLIMVSLSPALAEQYLTIPVIVCAYYWRSRLLWLYTIVGTMHVLMALGSLGILNHTPLLGAHALLSGSHLFLTLIKYAHLQFILLMFLISSVARYVRRLPAEATVSGLEVRIV